MKLRAWLRQRRYTKWHRSVEQGGTIPRLVTLSYDPLSTFNGRRPWCDTRLQDCPNPGHALCCYCTHTDRNPHEGDPK